MELWDGLEYYNATGFLPGTTHEIGTLTVDTSGNINSAWINLTTTTAPFDNNPPVSDAGGPYGGSEGSPVTFNGSGSYDLNGHIVSWEWDLDGDGIYEIDATETNGISNYTWEDDYFGDVRACPTITR
ncbi:MAG: PKD domain-containing protein [Halobacteriota archaeon]|nr:PKD domain-containing protein [Halobacteriota archaeon]